MAGNPFRTATVALAGAALLLSGGCFRSNPEKAARYEKKGDEYLAEGKPREAYVEFRNAVEKMPADGKLRWKLAKSAIAVGDFRKAYEETKRSVELAPANPEPQARLGEFYLAGGKTAEAKAIADNLVRLAPPYPRGYILLAGVAMQEKRYGEVIPLFEKGLAGDPSDYRAALAAAGFLALRNDEGGAARWYDRAVAIAPKESAVHASKGNFLFARGDVTGGEAEYRKAIELAKDRESVRIALADHLFQRGKVREAEGELDALSRDTGSLAAKKRVVEMALRIGKVDKARTVLAAIRKEAPKDTDGMLFEARLLLQDGKAEEARSLLSDVIRQDTSLSRAHHYIGVAEVALGNFDIARKELSEAVRLEPSNYEARTALAALLLRAGAPADAEKEALEALRVNPGSIPAAMVLSDSFVSRKQYAQAERIYGSMIRQMPANPLGYHRMGLSRMLQGKREDGRDYLRKAYERAKGDLTVAADYAGSLAVTGKAAEGEAILAAAAEGSKGNPLALQYLGRYRIKTKRDKEGEQDLLRSIAAAPRRVEPYRILGGYYISGKRFADADALLRKGAEQTGDGSVMLLLALSLESGGKRDEAAKTYRQVLEKGPGNALAANNLAGLIVESGGNLDEALKYAQVAREHAPDDPSVADTLGWIHFRKGLPDSALPLLKEASGKLRGNATVRYHFGMALAAKGEKRQAGENLREALRLDPSFKGAEEAHRTLANL